MTEDERQLVIARYQDAIEALRTYRRDEPDQQKRDEAGEKIRSYHDQIIDLAWLGVVSRTQALNDLADDLRRITAEASDTQTLSGAISEIGGVIAAVSDALGPEPPAGAGA